ncbi:unnamed protein product, partial [Closterium sp. NIES-54]
MEAVAIAPRLPVAISQRNSVTGASSQRARSLAAPQQQRWRCLSSSSSSVAGVSLQKSVAQARIAKTGKASASRLVVHAKDESFDYDLIIIGAGVGGHGAALHAVEQ